VRVGGNLGTPALDLLVGLPDDPVAAGLLFVLELSSFQLETTFSLDPAAAALLNLSPDHLDRYAGFAEYAAAKRRIFAGGGVMVLNLDDPVVASMADPDRRVVGFTLNRPGPDQYGLLEQEGNLWLAHGARPLLPMTALALQGLHNVANALAALALGTIAGLSMDAMLATLRRFSGLPHRSQLVAIRHGVRWYNDSKATNVGSAIAAIQGLQKAAGKLVLIAGGDGKGADFAPLRGALTGVARGFVLLGRDALRLKEVLTGLAPIVHVQNMREAVAEANRLAQPGDTVLLSPACASLDMYTGYQARGDDFIAEVKRGESA
jgi:UDP-N-acetylmuramoylalanine--D-glutamate ligase